MHFSRRLLKKSNKNQKRYTSSTCGLAGITYNKLLSSGFLSFPVFSYLVVFCKCLSREKILVPKMVFDLVENTAVKTLRQRSSNQKYCIKKFNCAHGHPKAKILKAVMHSQSFEFLELNSDTHLENVFLGKESLFFSRVSQLKET